MHLHTMKFGGTSVGNPDAIENVMHIIQRDLAQGQRIVVIVSAMSGVTDMLLESVRSAVRGDKWNYLKLNKDIRDKHEDAISALIRGGGERTAAMAHVAKLLDQHVELCEAVRILGEATPRIQDTIVSFGERLSSRLVAAALRDRGVEAEAHDASKFIVTDARYGNAEPLWEVTEARIREKIPPLLEAGIVPIITGFIGATPDGSITTLGRGGSDFSAAIFAAYLDADELTIWTDVDGVMTTDPRVDPRARVLSHISYAEVGELAYYGAKVLHPKTVQPIISKNIPLRVRNTFNYDHPGTTIGKEATDSKSIVKAVTSIRKVSMLTVSGKGMLGVPGIAGRTFLATARAGASILMISQSSSEQSFCYTIPEEHGLAVKQAVEQELAAEIQRQDVDSVEVTDSIVIVTVVGSGMRNKPGVAGRVFTTLGDRGINVLAIAQGSSECSISFVIDGRDLEAAVCSLHELTLG
ncbi:MAG: aspartate kinase, monofunctional class [Anaerolineae bacterium]|nr:aspartate kinase, monofunctional class [Anaerolineae bacterium]